MLHRVEDLDVRCRARPCPRWPRCSNCDHVRDLKLEHASVMPDFITLDAFLARCRNGARMSQVVGLRCAGARSAWRRTGFGSMRRGSRGTGPHSTWFTVVHRGSPCRSAPFCHALPPPEVTESPMCTPCTPLELAPLVPAPLPPLLPPTPTSHCKITHWVTTCVTQKLVCNTLHTV